MMHRNRSVNVHDFAMVPKSNIPRSRFDRQFCHKTTFDSGYLIPVYVDEVLPGDTFNLKMTAFARLATPIFPLMDNLHLDSFFFFVPNRLVWLNWIYFMGEQNNPADSISFSIPQSVSPLGGYIEGSLQDYMGLPTTGVNAVGAGNTVTHSSLFLRAYNLIWNQWFRDENLQNSVPNDLGNGPDLYTDFTLLRRGKRKDYFSGCLPWAQKGTAVSLPLGISAPVFGNGLAMGFTDGGTDTYGFSTGITYGSAAAGNFGSAVGVAQAGAIAANNTTIGLVTKTLAGANPSYSGLYADLSSATSATINALRQSFQIQKLLEHDARGGTRYTEIVRSHFGVISPDARLQRPEYLGGASVPIRINPIAQTSASAISGSTTPIGTLSAIGTVLAQGQGFTQSFTEHGMLIGLVSVRADLSYNQGIRKMWRRLTRYDFYFPVFAMLGEQAVLNEEIYCDGSGASGNDGGVFGYQERWGEYRYYPSMITGFFRTTNATSLDAWHLCQHFAGLPTLNSTYIQDNPPVSRIVAVGSGANGQQFIFDSFFDIRCVRPMPMYSVPGLIDHF